VLLPCLFPDPRIEGIALAQPINAASGSHEAREDLTLQARAIIATALIQSLPGSFMPNFSSHPGALAGA
jgi:hypothetical protein